MQLNQEGFYEIYPIHYVPFWEQSWFMMFGAFLLFLVFAIFIFLIVRRMRNKRRAAPAWKVALAKLEAVAVRDINSEYEFRCAYAIMTDIVKEYIQDHYGFSVRHLTDDELVEFFKQVTLEKASLEKVGHIFEAAAGIKFAPKLTLSDRVQEDLKVIRSFIYATRTLVIPSKIN